MPSRGRLASAISRTSCAPRTVPGRRRRVAALTLAAAAALTAALLPATGASAAAPHPGPSLILPYRPFAGAGAELARARQMDSVQPRETDSATAQRGLSPATVANTPTGTGPAAAAVDQATDTIYAANYGSGPNGGGKTVSVIDGRTCRAADLSRCRRRSPAVTVGNSPSGLTVDQATDTIYVTNFSSDTVSVIDGATCNSQVTSGCTQTPPQVPVGGNPAAVTVDSANHTAYVVNAASNNVSMINIATCNATHLSGCSSQHPPSVKVGIGPAWAAVNQKTHTVYVANDNAVGAPNSNNGTTVSVFDASACNATTQVGCSHQGLITVGTGPIAIAVDAGSNTVYTANIGANTVSAIDGRTCNANDLAGCAGQTPGTVTVGQAPDAAGLDSSAHTLYIANADDDTLSVIDTSVCNGRHRRACSRQVASTVQAGAEPLGAAVNPATHTLYAPNAIDNDASVIDISRCNAADTVGCRARPPVIPLGGGPGMAVVNPATRTVYVANQFTGTVQIINGAACNAHHPGGCQHIAAAVKVGSAPIGVAVNPATDTVYVANLGDGGNSVVRVINGAACNAIRTAGCQRAPATIHVGKAPIGIAVDPVTDTVYVANTLSNTISVINGATCNGTDHSGCGQVPTTLAAKGLGFGLTINERTRTLYAVAANDKLAVFNAATCNAGNTTGCGQAPATVKVGSFSRGAAVDAATDTIYVANNALSDAPASVSVINGATCNGTHHSGCGQASATVAVGRGAFGVAVDRAAGKIIVTSSSDASVSLINAATCNATHTSGCARVPAKMAVGSGAIWVAVSSRTATAYVSDFNDNDLAVISTGR